MRLEYRWLIRPGPLGGSDLLYLDIASVLDEDKDIFDCIEIACRGQHDVPPQVTVFGLNRFESGNGAGMSGHLAIAQPPQFIEQWNGTHAALHQVRVGAKLYFPGLQLFCVALRRVWPDRLDAAGTRYGTRRR